MKELNVSIQAKEAEDLFNNLIKDIDIWLKDHPASKRIEDEIVVAVEDVKSYKENFLI